MVRSMVDRAKPVVGGNRLLRAALEERKRSKTYRNLAAIDLLQYYYIFEIVAVVMLISHEHFLGISYYYNYGHCSVVLLVDQL